MAIVIDLDLAGRTVDRLEFSTVLDMAFSDGSMLRVETDLQITAGDGQVTDVDPATPVTVAPALALLHAEVVAATAGDDGGLDVAFADGTRLRVDPDDAYEAWSFGGGGHRGLLSGPGGVI
jgi:hypothetical protein